MINAGMVFCDRHYGGINYPLGGVGRIPEALAEGLRERGSFLVYKANVGPPQALLKQCSRLETSIVSKTAYTVLISKICLFGLLWQRLLKSNMWLPGC